MKRREKEREIAYTKAKRRRGSRVFQVGKPRGGFGTFAARVSHSRERKGSILFNREDLPCLEEARPKSAILIDANYRLIACHRCDLSSFKWHSENLTLGAFIREHSDVCCFSHTDTDARVLLRLLPVIFGAIIIWPSRNEAVCCWYHGQEDRTGIAIECF